MQQQARSYQPNREYLTTVSIHQNSVTDDLYPDASTTWLLDILCHQSQPSIRRYMTASQSQCHTNLLGLMITKKLVHHARNHSFKLHKYTHYLEFMWKFVPKGWSSEGNAFLAHIWPILETHVSNNWPTTDINS